MSSEKTRPTVDEIYELLKRTSIPTVLVEGKDDIIFYRSIEHELRDLDVDMLPAGNKDAVLELRNKIKEGPVSVPVVFVVDNDLWVYSITERPSNIDDVITTTGYSIENDLFVDGDLEDLLIPEEVARFKAELSKFLRWYALSIYRNINGAASSFRTHAGKVLDDEDFYKAEVVLYEGEVYPEALLETIQSNYGALVRGKSLFALLLRQLSAKNRHAKFGGKQLMAIGASRKGSHFQRIQTSVRESLELALNCPTPS
ncbi:DUF4435 domain-containing protein [Burkholderia sp. Ac-20379]|uniref:DUF4435 domain-containing protein n=1 Tax=Burkholderia sp. Ac-20379 TaxID=2703900 RepID=UPI00198210BB|nr:DUF4435 domain-containing protein [Burkholderia sp. Ac-20379]MBN3726999.1 DUF4435 domain-containing protein [Burkholderia sp. Ac-20379]